MAFDITPYIDKSPAEVRALIEATEGDMGLRCPHGRPAVVKMKKSEIEKLFKRIV